MRHPESELNHDEPRAVQQHIQGNKFSDAYHGRLHHSATRRRMIPRMAAPKSQLTPGLNNYQHQASRCVMVEYSY